MKIKLTLLLIAFVFVNLSGYCKTVNGIENGRYAELVSLRMISIAERLINYEDEVIFRLKKKRDIDEKTVIARIISARLQFKKLIKLKRYLIKNMKSSDPKIARVKALNQKLRYFVTLHRKKIKILKSLASFSDIDEHTDKLIDTINDNTGTLNNQYFHNIQKAF